MKLNTQNAEFVLSAARLADCPRDSLPQIAFAGRSNVGKSSVINRLLNRKNFARVGSAPGKTTHINYFRIDRKVYFVDLPGYGYAKVSKQERARWGRLIEQWFADASLLTLGILLVDLRHKPTADDCVMAQWFKDSGKPFVVVVNSREPRGEAARELCSRIQETYQVKALCADCQTMSAQEIGELLRDLLYAFPMQELRVYLPRWMDGLEYDHPVKAALYDALAARAGEISEMCQAETVLGTLTEVEHVAGCRLREIDLGSGMVACELQFPESLYYDILSGKTGFDITGEGELMELLTELAQVKRSYDKIASALEEASATGYGVVMPTRGEMKLEAPEIVRKGSAYGVKLKAGAPSIHMLRVDLDTEISPMVGDEKQSQDLVNSLSEQYQTAPDQLWESNIFGKSVFEMVNDGLTTKLRRMSDDVRVKFRGSLARVVNEGATGMICIIF